MDKITMSKKEIKQAQLFDQIEMGLITRRDAAKVLKLSERWVCKKYKRYVQNGCNGLLHGNSGMKSQNSWAEEHQAILIERLKSDWIGFGPTFAAEKLQEIYNITVSKETVRQVMIKNGLWVAKAIKSKHRRRRARRANLGMMVQLDGSPHDWFEGRGPYCTLLVFIDDATSKILWLEFAPSESVNAVMKATKNYVARKGIPHSFYVDHGSVFHVNLNNKDGDKITQWERAIQELNSKVIHAHSPQAKGRVERCNETMQDRLVKEMRLVGISSIDQANEYLRTSDFIEKHNTKFAKPPYEVGDVHVSVKNYDLEMIFCIRETRSIANDFIVSFDKRIFQLHAEQRTIIRPKDEVTVSIDLYGAIRLFVRNTELQFNEIDGRPAKPPKKPKTYNQKSYKPSQNSRRWASGILPVESRVKPATPAAEAL